MFSDIETKKKQVNSIRERFSKKIEKFLDQIIDEKSNSTIRDEVKEFKHLVLEHFKSKLNKQKIINEKIISETQLYYEQRIKTIMERNKVIVETEKIEFDLKIKKIKLSLALFKYYIQEKNDEADNQLIISIDNLLKVIEYL